VVQVSVLTEINNINLPDSLAWTRTNLSVADNDSTFPVPTPFLSSALDRTLVRIHVQNAQEEPRFALIQGENEEPQGMELVENFGISPVRLEFSTPIYAFSTYIRVGTVAVWASTRIEHALTRVLDAGC
jgi:hypothetical protein